MSNGQLEASPRDPTVLDSLPYDLILNIAQHLELRDVDALQLTCRYLHDCTTTRPVFRKLAHDLLRRCRALPLKGFQRLSDLSTAQLIRSVHRAAHYERAWKVRAPRPAANRESWYRVVSAPPNEEVDWLSPITSSYTLCATKSGKVVCWDVQTDECLAEWVPDEKWELWKCRVEFDNRTVFFTMAKVISGSYDDDRIMEFVLMRLSFPEVTTPVSSPTVKGSKSIQDPPAPTPPVFSRVTAFMTMGVVMNVFLLDPPARLLSAFVWVERSNTIGLYALLDWAKQEYVFIDTGIECLLSSNWSCILHESQIVIHSEETNAAYQHFYPIDLLKEHVKCLTPNDPVPAISSRVFPARMLSKNFIFPQVHIPPESDTGANAGSPEPPASPSTSASTHTILPLPSDTTQALAPPDFNFDIHTQPDIDSSSQPDDDGDGGHPNDGDNPNGNPFPFPPWYPESAHFVRQWWPTLSGVPRLSCTVVLLAEHDPDTHKTSFVLAQHYFRVPLTDPNWKGKGKCLSPDAAAAEDAEDSLMKLWYVSKPFEVVCVLDGSDDEEALMGERPRPLIAVDFGHAVWIEYEDTDTEERMERLLSGMERKHLRFVTFPAVDETTVASESEGVVRTLEVPDELDMDSVETINIDQSQGAVIMSVKEGKIFILSYE